MIQQIHPRSETPTHTHTQNWWKIEKKQEMSIMLLSSFYSVAKATHVIMHLGHFLLFF